MEKRRQTPAHKPARGTVTSEHEKAAKETAHYYEILLVPDNAQSVSSAYSGNLTYNDSWGKLFKFLDQNSDHYTEMGIMDKNGSIIIKAPLTLIERLMKEDFIERMPIPGNQAFIHPVGAMRDHEEKQHSTAELTH
jgi:hypothetical protein